MKVIICESLGYNANLAIPAEENFNSQTLR